MRVHQKKIQRYQQLKLWIWRWIPNKYAAWSTKNTHSSKAWNAIWHRLFSGSLPRGPVLRKIYDASFIWYDTYELESIP